MALDKVRITFYLDGRPHAQRIWWAVPRKGEGVVLKVYQSKKLFIVDEVVYLFDDADVPDRQAVNITVKPVED